MTHAPPYVFPLRIRKSGESYFVEDAHRITLAYVYFEDEPTRRGLVNRLSSEDAKALVQTIARALTAEAEGKRIGEERP
ncbi:hypothetical protein [Methylocystis sp. B8]|uniref:hypothetical protein n=1 Tax=Methylocystis sp. B8 TaxID=544938 RepID=UPI0010FF3D89|nr:hypothetical protein [Methylocystis sp. B8]TLG77814.1 hypothetical protein FEV16_08320 [Methylocystis sp. B8]